jgi:hypothetical protein
MFAETVSLEEIIDRAHEFLVEFVGSQLNVALLPQMSPALADLRERRTGPMGK